jgi:hypothetical protein
MRPNLVPTIANCQTRLRFAIFLELECHTNQSFLYTYCISIEFDRGVPCFIHFLSFF